MVQLPVPSTNPGSAREAWTRPTARVDWLAGPIMHEDPNGTDAVEFWLDPPPERCTPDTGFRGYDWWRHDAHGSKIARTVETDRYGDRTGTFTRTYLILKGTGLAALRAKGIDDREALARFRLWGGRCKRLDLAIDVLHPEITPLALYERHQARLFVTRLSEPALWGDREQGQTFYLIGKDQCFRAYDKSAERQRKGVALEDGITRLEMELRGPWAKRAARDLTALLDRPDWETAFPAFVAGLILGKARPLNDPKPERNPQRAPVWTPLAEVLRDVQPVRLSPEELNRSALQQIAGQILHFSNDLRGLKLMRSIMGDAPFLQALDREKLDNHQLLLAALAQQKPEEIRSILEHYGLSDLDAPDDEDGAEVTL